MSYNVPEDEKPAFNKKVQESLGILAGDIGETLSRVKNLQPETLVEAYNRPIDDEIAPQRDMVSITPYEQSVTDIVGSEVDSLRNDAGEIASSPLEVFAKPLDANKIKALGFVDGEGKATEKGELFFHLKNSGVFNEDGTITEKGQAYLLPRNEIGKPENIKAFKTWYDDYLDEPMQSDSEIFGAVVGFGKNLLGGLYDVYQTKEKLTNPFGLLDVVRQTAAGKKTIAELKTDQIASLEQIAKNFQNIGGYADIIQGLTGRALYEGAAAATGVPMQEMKDAAEENLYLARQRQWKANENLRDLEVGEIAEAITGLDGFVKMADEAKATLGEEQFNQRYAGVSAVTEMVADPANLIPAGTAFKVASSAPIASRAILKAQQTLGKVAQVEQALNKAQTIVEAGNTILKKEAVAVPLAQKLFTDISARAGSNPELLARAQQALDAGRRITAGADEVRAAMPNAIASVDELAAKRASLATRIPEEYAKKVLQTAELGAKIRSAPAKTVGAILERTGNTLTKVDNAVTGFFSERGLDQAYNAALGAAGVVGLAGNPIVGTIGAGAAALKAGKFITEYGKIFKYVGKEMERARSSIPFWKRVGYHTAPKSLGQGLSHAFNIFELGGATSDILRRVGRGIVAAYPSDLFFEYLSDGGDMRPQTMTRAAAESLVIGGSFAAGGGAFMGTNKRMREIAINDEINFRQGLVDTAQKARFEALPPVVRRSLATYSMANPTLNYNFIESGNSEYDPNSNTANININSTYPLKALVAHETLHHTIIKNNMEGGIAAMFLGDTKTNSVGGLFRSKGGKLDPEFEAFANKYYDRMRDSGMSDASIKTTYPLEKVAVEYFIEQHSDQYAAMAESGELGAIAARGEVRKKLGSVLETILPKIPVLRDLHFKSGGAIDANGAFVKGVGILGDDGLRQNPIANRMFKEMNRRSSGMMPGQFEPLISDKEGSGAPLMFDPANAIDMELMHPFIQVDENDKPILKDGRPVFIDKSVDIDRAMAGLTAVEAMRKRRESNYIPEKGEAYVDDEGELQPGWLSDAVLNEMFAKHKFNNEQKRMIRQYNRIVKDGKGQRMVMINFPATIRLKSGKVVYAPQKAAIRDSAPVAITISKDGNILYGLMSVTKLQENIKKRAQSKRGKKLYAGNIDAILQDVQAMMDFHLNRPTEDSIVYFNEKYGVVEGDQRKKFINTMFGLLNKKEQAVLNPMLLEDGVKSSDNVYRTYRADRVSKAIPMSPDEYAAMPFSYEAVSAVKMPEQRQMPEVSPEESKNWFKQNRSNFIHVNIRGNEIDPTRDFTGWVLPVGRDAVPDANVMNTRYGRVGKQVVLVPKEFVTTSKYNPDMIKPGFRPSPDQIGTITEESINKNGTIDWSKVFAKPKDQQTSQMPEQAQTRQMPEDTDISPEDLNPIENRQEAEGLFADGKRIFAFHEMDEKLFEITSLDVLKRYPPDSMGWMEPEAQTGQMRFMPEKLPSNYQSSRDTTFLYQSIGPDGIVNLSRPIKSTEALPTISTRHDYPIEDFTVSKFDKRSSILYTTNKNGEPVTFKFDPQLMKKPEFADFDDLYDGAVVQLAMADRHGATDGDMGGHAFPDLKVNQDFIVDDGNGKKYKLVWSNNAWGPVKNMSTKAQKYGATTLLTYNMDPHAHDSNTRTVRIFSNEIANSGLSQVDQSTLLIVMNVALKKAQSSANKQHLRSLLKTQKGFVDALKKDDKAISQAKGYVGKKPLSPEDRLSLENDIEAITKDIENENKFLEEALGTKLAGEEEMKVDALFRNYQNKRRAYEKTPTSEVKKKAMVDAEKELKKYQKTKEFKKAESLLPSRELDKFSNTFKGRKSLILAVKNKDASVKWHGFDSQKISQAIGDQLTGDSLHIVSSVELSKDPNFKAVYLGDDPREIARMSPQEQQAAQQLKSNPDFVPHEAYLWSMLGPAESKHIYNTNQRSVLESFPDFVNEYSKLPVKEGKLKLNDPNSKASEFNIVNTIRDQSKIGIVFRAKKGKKKATNQ